MTATGPIRAAPLSHRLSILGLGTYSGVMLAIGLGLGRYWLSLPPTTFAAWFTPNFWFLLPTVAITLPVALVGTAGAWRLAAEEERARWRTVLLLLGATLAVTLAYHLPANIRIWSGELDDGQLRGELTWWLIAHLFRLGPAILATDLAVRASFGSRSV